MAEKKYPIKSIKINNYKSIIEVSIQLGTFNVFIGANGCGKSNILEAIALGAAASINKIDFEYFANRGIRVTDPLLLFPSFSKPVVKEIQVEAVDSKNDFSLFHIKYDDTKLNVLRKSNLIKRILVKNADKDTVNDKLNKYRSRAYELMYTSTSTFIQLRIMPLTELDNFMIFSLEESKLRKDVATNRIYPLGNHGEGLFAYLKEIARRKNASSFLNEVKDNLAVFDWFDDIDIPNGQLSNEYNVQLKDKYLDNTLNTFDQRSTNEGFLYLLFYLTLIISDETPKFFAIENIDASFNPKLCRVVIQRLIALAKKHGKQIIVTTHNPVVLDGLNLNDETVCLYTIRRTVDGDTNASKVNLKGNLSIPLSEAWLRGYIGGLPDNF